MSCPNCPGVVEPLGGVLELVQAEPQPCASRQELVLHVLEIVLRSPGFALLTGGRRKIRSFREDDKPHGLSHAVEPRKCLLESALVLLPISGQEDEVVELCTPADDWDIPEGLFQDDVDESVHVVSVCDPPEIQPVRVELVISHQDHAIREIALQTPVLLLDELANHARVSADSDDGRRPPLGQTGDQDGEAFFRVGHVPFVELRVNQLQRCTQKLRCTNAVALSAQRFDS
jgi:hypothetical protein